MADTVSPMITGAVTQTIAKVLAEAPAEALAMVYQVFGQSVSLSMQNATAAQQNMNTIASTAVATAVKPIIQAGGSG